MDALKLAALDAEDLAVIAACLQDAVVKIGDIDWRPREKRLTLALNRFVWEKADRVRRGGERRRSVLHLARVESLRSTRIRRDAPDAVLALLTVRFEPSDGPAGSIFLEFAGGGRICASVECIEASLVDLGAAWATANRPAHETE